MSSPVSGPRAGRVPFSSGFEVEMFRSNRCALCRHADPEFGDCEEFALGVVVEGGWPDLLVEVERDETNPLGIECARFEQG
jgi:hypothetical protein